MIHTFEDLLEHAGHEVETVYYGTPNLAVNAAIECVTCNTVLVDLNPGDTISKELAEDAGGRSIAHVWHIDDVLSRAKERNINLSEDQAIQILDKVDKGKDASIGINWDVIDTVIDIYLEEISNG